MEQQAGISTNKNFDIPIRSYAYIGDAVYEIFAREKIIYLTSKPEKLHKIATSIVNSEFQADLIEKIQDFLNQEEKEIIRRARNLSVTTARRTNQKLHRLSTAFEALIGYLYLNNPDRLKDLYDYINPLIHDKIDLFNKIN
ncbi:MAG: ribonuclease III domain-containing protein [bacterium]